IVPNASCFFYLMPRRAPKSTLFPYTTLFRSKQAVELFGDLIEAGEESNVRATTSKKRSKALGIASEVAEDVYVLAVPKTETVVKDRKSTRLNSSHVKISYAVFCLKKKTPSSA